MITVPLWVLYISFGYLVLNAVSNALSLVDKTFYGFFVRFMRSFTMGLTPFMEQELHIKLPTQADGNTGQIDSSASTSIV